MIFGNCSKHSFTTSLAALPTDFIVIAAKAYGIIEPDILLHDLHVVHMIYIFNNMPCDSSLSQRPSYASRPA